MIGGGIGGISDSLALSIKTNTLTPTPKRIHRAPSRLLAHGLTALAAAQLLAGVALSWMWSTIKRGVEAVRACVREKDHTTNQPK